MTDDLLDTLAREAAAVQPAFSESLHQRVMSGIPPLSPKPAGLRPAHAAWAAVAAAGAFIALWALRPAVPPPGLIRDTVPIVTVRLRTPPVPDVPRQASRVLRRATLSLLEHLEGGPIPLSFPEAKARLLAGSEPPAAGGPPTAPVPDAGRNPVTSPARGS